MTELNTEGHKVERATRVRAIKETLETYNAQERTKLTEFAHAEDAAHNVAYYLDSYWQPGENINMLDADGEVREYKVIPIETINTGIVGFILVGTEPENNRIHVVFRGTVCKTSMVRDTEANGAGHESFRAEQDVILAQIIMAINDRVNSTNRKQTVSFSGHSLGGADAQNCAAAFLEATSRMHAFKHRHTKSRFNRHTALASVNTACLLMVKEIVINKVNSAGVSHHSHKRSTRHAEHLAKKGVKIKVRALMVAGDGVQKSGQSSILHDAPPEVADVQVLKVTSNYEGGLPGINKVKKAASQEFTTKSVFAWMGLYLSKVAMGLAIVVTVVGVLAAACVIGSLLPVLLPLFYFAPVMAAGVALALVTPILGAAAVPSVPILYSTASAHVQQNFVTPMQEGEYEHFTNATPEGADIVKRKLTNKTKEFDNNPLSRKVKKGSHTVGSLLFERTRSISPKALAQYELFKSDKDHLYNIELFDNLVEEHNRGETPRVTPTAHVPLD